MTRLVERRVGGTSRGFRAATALPRRLAARRRLAVAAVGLLAFGASAALSALRQPAPRVHDEFSYLLAADTFARGRLSNPPHPLWPHFETFHVLMTPRYASKYPPGQGLFLAAGRVLSGRPIVGAWLGVALGSAAVCWMLQAWTRPRWALLGGVFTALHHGVHGGIAGWGAWYSWSQSFWGGGPALLGGALALGAAPRILRRPSRAGAVALGLGLVLLAITRPLEGAVVGLPVVAVVAVACLRSPRSARVVAPPLLIVTGAGAAVLLTYHQAVTGSPLRMPYALYETTYNPVPILTAGAAPGPPPVYRHEVLRRFFTDWCAAQWELQRDWHGWWRYHRERLGWAWSFFVGPLVLPLAMLPGVLRRAANRAAAALTLAVVVLHLLTVGLQPHYAAPVFGAFMLLVVEGARRLALVRIGRFRLGRCLVAATVLLVVVKLGSVGLTRASARPGWEDERAGIEASLARTGGRHLVVVRYAPGHDPLEEWVYNEADIDGTPAVWAREMDAPAMRRLLDYFRDRRAWLLDADAVPRRLTPYVP